MEGFKLIPQKKIIIGLGPYAKIFSNKTVDYDVMRFYAMKKFSRLKVTIMLNFYVPEMNGKCLCETNNEDWSNQ